METTWTSYGNCPTLQKPGQFEIQPSKSLDFEGSRILNGQSRDHHCIEVCLIGSRLYIEQLYRVVLVSTCEVGSDW